MYQFSDTCLYKFYIHIILFVYIGVFLKISFQNKINYKLLISCAFL